MRIWYQSAVEIEGAAAYRQALEAHFARTADAGTTVELHGVEPGTWAGRQPSQLMGYPAIFHAALGGPFLRNALTAEREGYDAFVVGTYIEPFLRELRSLVDIPVVSSLESMALTACSLGRRPAVVTLNDELKALVHAGIERHGLGSRMGPVLVVEPGLTEAELTGLFSDPAEYLERFRKAARRALEHQADVIIPGEAILAVIVAGNGLTEIDGASVMDGIGIPVAQAEMMVKLWQRTGLRPGRRWSFRRPAADVVSAFEGRWKP